MAGRERASRGLLTFLCVAFSAWAIDPDLAHIPKVLSVLDHHAELVAEHGHSHGLEEDLAWALHGHAHDKADHDHGTEVIVAADLAPPLPPSPEARPASRPRDGPAPVFRHERPPRV
ncbi:MAG: hypothetical protein AAFR52_14905 [Pseudomonadota bacterium]